jgi:hypothetical protein
MTNSPSRENDQLLALTRIPRTATQKTQDAATATAGIRKQAEFSTDCVGYPVDNQAVKMPGR